MWHVYAFLILFALSCSLALCLGGSPERLVSAILLAAVGLTSVVGKLTSTTFAIANPAFLAVDLTASLATTAVALKANRFWPIWVASLMFQQVLSHLLMIADPTLFPWLYWLTSSFWGFPIQAILLIGTIQYHRTPLPRVKPWSAFSRPSDPSRRKQARSR